MVGQLQHVMPGDVYPRDASIEIVDEFERLQPFHIFPDRGAPVRVAPRGNGA